MLINQQFRAPFLAVIFAGAILVLGKLILSPTSAPPEITSFVFPPEVPLPQWRLSESFSPPEPKAQAAEIISQNYYRYIQNSKQLDIDMRYLMLEYTHFSIKNLTPISTSAIVRQHQKVGFYGLGIDQQRAYLSSCINPRGGSTFTVEQFNRNRYLYDLRPQYFLSWLLGKDSLLDRRCLWVNLSVPLQGSSPQAAYQVLENAWIPWYQWWEIRFPQP
ncbi:cyanoexosortase A system-associated protein [Fortiea contorta]|uniref:cyanoexosortase A system-associated protein n=1 Tax=Fortiea contorta TaxID=1892405 RepID=UPI00034DE943|nr:cyanoexosortase A system-associated protein [Fortiea contorta]